jgi:hypothetical protein
MEAGRPASRLRHVPLALACRDGTQRVRGLAVFRWAAWVWMATVLVLPGAPSCPGLAVGLVAAALVVTVWLTVLLRRDPGAVAAPAVGAEVGVALSLQLADGFVYRAPHVFQPEQPLGVAWPIAAILAAGVAFGPWAGAAPACCWGSGVPCRRSSTSPPIPAGDAVSGGSA